MAYQSIWANGFLGWDLTTRGVEIDLAGVWISCVLLTSDQDTQAFLLLWFEKESSWYWKIPLEDALVLALRINHRKYGLKPYMKHVDSPSVS